MTISELLGDLRRRSIVLTAVGNDLRVRAPEGALTQDLTSAIKARKQEIITLFQKLETAPPEQRIEAATVEGEERPLSFAQQRLWFLAQLEPGSTAYAIPTAVRLRGSLDIHALASALSDTVERHHALRTRFLQRDGEAFQQVAPAEAVPLPITELNSCDDARIEEWTRREASQPFSLERGPLLRARLLRFSASHHVLLLTLHHIAADGWSIGILMRELAAGYAARKRGERAALPRLSLQYGDYAAWQRQQWQGEQRERQLQYWRQQLAGAVPLRLPTDRPRSVQFPSAGKTCSILLERQLAGNIKAFARTRNATPFMVLLAAYQATLSRYSGQPDFVVGTPIANRQRPELEDLIGCFINTLALRADCTGDPAFALLLDRVRECTLAAYAHQDAPFEQLIEELQPNRNSELFQALFSFQNAPTGRLEGAGLILESLPFHSETTKFEQQVNVWEEDSEFHVSLTYSSALFLPSHAEAFLRSYRELLRAGLEEPDRAISTLPLIAAADVVPLLTAAQGAPLRVTNPLPVHQRFEDAAARKPDAIAVEWGEQTVTYEDLNKQANQLARLLMRRGAGVERKIAVLLERSPEAVAAFLAVLKAGAAYVPVDPQSPADRIAWILNDAQVHLVITRQSLWKDHANLSVQTIDLDEEMPAILAESAANPELLSVREATAYVIYTSGSTGHPKGVVVSQHNLAASTQARFDSYPDQVLSYLLLSPLAFDSSVAGLYWTLSSGGKLVLPESTQIVEPLALLDTIRKSDVSHLLALPSLYLALLGQERGEMQRLRSVIVAGEPCLPSLLSTHFQVVPQARLYNEYGPTEGTVWATVHECALANAEATNIPIGRPIPGVQAFVLDHAMRPVPAGMPGELYLGGEGVARGYLRRPELTAAAFLPNPFAEGEQRGRRLYRTGDRCRVSPHGELEFLGRLDDQIKIRGYRVEPAEIEAVLRSHAGVKDCAVIVWRDEQGEADLAAFFEAAASSASADDHIADVATLYDKLYSDAAAYAEEDHAINLQVWSSSYTQQPLPKEEIEDCLDETARRILQWKPGRVLEIGCGTGLLLFRIAPYCERYCGLDISEAALRVLDQQLEERGIDRSRVRLEQKSAHELHGLEEERFDTVVINEVVPHMPDLAYLLRTIELAIGVLQPSGRIFIGGVRSLPHQDLFYASLQLAEAADDVDRQRFLQRAEARRHAEKDLIVDPALFDRLPARIPAINAVSTRWKGGQFWNEITRFQYDVTLSMAPDSREKIAPVWMRWDEATPDLNAIRTLLETDSPGIIGWTGIANLRLAQEAELLAWSKQDDNSQTWHEWQSNRKAQLGQNALDPGALSAMGDSLGYQVEIYCPEGSDPAQFSALFHKLRQSETVTPLANSIFPSVDSSLNQRAWSSYANQARTSNLTAQLRSYLGERLPAYAVPRWLNAVDALPVNANGKLDRRALAETALEPDRDLKSHTPPMPGLEEKLAAIWEQLLGRHPIGRDENFFSLGGHSLLAVRVIARIADAFGQDLAVRDLFDAPTVAQLSLRLNIAQAAAEQGQSSIIEVSAVEDEERPLSFAQQRLWFLSQWEPDSTAYAVPAAVRLRGALDRRALAAALSNLIERHHALRTRFLLRDGEAYQQVVPAEEASLPVTELNSSDEQQIAQWSQREAAQPFSLERGSLLRARLLRLSEHEHVLLLTLHHIAADGWSVGILVRELAAIYSARLQGESPALAPLPLQYGDYAVWQRQQWQGERREHCLTYWRRQLAGMAQLRLPTDRPRSPSHSAGAALAFTIGEDTAERLRALAAQQGATLFMVLLAAWQILLARYSGQEDICVGCPVANRPRRELDALIGFFVNTLVLRGDLRGNPTFRELLRRTRQMALAAFDHEDAPFEQLVDDLHPERDLTRNPLFQVMFSYEKAAEEPIRLPEITAEFLPPPIIASKFDLTLHVVDIKHGLQGSLEYPTALFDRETLARMVEQWQMLLKAIGEDPGLVLSDLPSVTMQERGLLLNEWNAPSETEAQFSSVIEQFETWAEHRPGAEALTGPGARWTYQQLNECANQIAHHLLSLGVTAETRVGISLERSPELIAAIVAVLKTGGSYVPLDPNYPAERLAFLRQDADAKLVIVDSRKEAAQTFGAAHVIALQDDRAAIQGQPLTNPRRTIQPDGAAYIIYTSGSTGQPKGVVVTHRNVARLFQQCQPFFHFGPEDVWTLFHSYAFDFSVWEIWGALLYGGRLVIPEHWVSRSPEAFHALLAAEGVTVLNQTPSAFRQLIQADLSAARPLPLRFVIFGGEPLIYRHLKTWFDRHGDAQPRLVNMYGITETTVHVTWRAIAAQEAEDASGSLIGRPIPDLTLYILDRHMNLAPIGAVGEIYVGGEGVARGYWNHGGLTASRFIPDSFGKHAGGRLYRSGDLGRYQTNGDIQHLGRADQQLKIRGHRIEPGEIETALEQYAGVRNAAVMARHDSDGELRLIGYIAGEQVSSDALRSFLRLRLPDHMIPSAFVLLPAIPLTVNGKLDRAALPAPDYDTSERRARYIGPRSPAEHALTAAWEQTLQVADIGIRDNFFELGGDSIRSIQAQSRAAQRGFTFTLQQLFQHPTIEALAKYVVEVQAESLPHHSDPFALISATDRERMPSDVEDAYPLARLQAGMLFHGELSQTATYHDIFSYLVEQPFDEAALRLALSHIARRHPVLRTSFDLTNFSTPLQLVHTEVTVPSQVTDLRRLQLDQQNEFVEKEIAAEKKKSFDWTQPPLLRFQALLRHSDSFQLILGLHHSILDGWSLASFLAELLDGYSALVQRKALPSRASFGSSYRDFVALEQEAIASEETRRFWHEHAGEPDYPLIPHWHTLLGANSRGERSVQTITVPLTTGQASDLQAFADVEGIPLKSSLLAAHIKVLSFVTGRNDAVTGLVANGRPEAADGEKLLGLFLNTLVFRPVLRPGSWRELVRQVYSAERLIFPHRRYPLATLQSELGGRSLFQAAFNYTHFHVLDSVQSGPLTVRDGSAFEETNFDLLADFSLDVNRETLRLWLKYDAGLFSQLQMEQLGSYYVSALRLMTESPDELYQFCSLMEVKADESQDTPPLEISATLGSRFAECVARTPNSEAVSFEGSSLSYRELEAASSRLAGRLVEAGARPGACVGLCLDRSLEMVVAVIAIVRSGAAYLPLDPYGPPERMRFILADASPAAIVTSQAFQDTLPDNVPAVLIDADPESAAGSAPAAKITGAHPAYVIYTSGSTGQPKGVVVTHTNVLQLFSGTEERYGFGPNDTWMLFHSIAFDFSVWEFWGALLHGGRLVVPPAWLVRSPDAFYELLIRERVTVLNQTPSAFRQLMRVDEERFRPGQLSLRLVIFGGEALDFGSLQGWFERHGDAVPQLVNMYGITETTVHVTHRPLRAIDSRNSRTPIGGAIPGYRLYLLDEHQTPVPPGATGEMYVGGNGVAGAYLARPALTAQRFVPDPFSDRPGARLYRSGDLARRCPDGELHYLGRIDHQVKIRGHRVELGEIQAALHAHPAVSEALVIARMAVDGSHQLVGYFVAVSTPPSPAELNQFLKERLAEYMIPSSFIELSAFPLTANGKIDRAQLPEPGRSHRQVTAPYREPATETERKLAVIWRDVLRLEQVGVNDNFFALGGNSILALQLVALLRRQLDAEFPLHSLFEAPTVAELAIAIEEASERHTMLRPPVFGAGSSLLISLRAGSKGAPLFLIHPMGGGVFAYRQLANLLEPGQAVYAIRGMGLEEGEAVPETVEQMAELYSRIIRDVQTKGPYRLGGMSFGGMLAFAISRHLRSQGQESDLLMLFDTAGPGTRAIELSQDDAIIMGVTAGIAREEAQIVIAGIHSVHDRVRTMWQHLQTTGKLPSDVTLSVAKRLLTIWKTHSRAIEEYRPHPGDDRLLFFRAKELRGAAIPDIDRPWRVLSRGAAEVRSVPGDHYTLLQSPNVETLAAYVRRAISAAGAAVKHTQRV